MRLLEQYNHQQPFHLYLKQFFAGEKKFGSGDRKQIAAICYSYFRTAHAFDKKLSENILAKAVLLCNASPALLTALHPEWEPLINVPLPGKLSFFNEALQPFFPWKERLSDGIDSAAFEVSFTLQPDLYIRVRPGHYNNVVSQLKQHNILFNPIGEDCVSLPANTSLKEILRINKEVVVQDYNSQQVLNYLKRNSQPTHSYSIWDCCAASGGKSILATDILNNNTKLTVTDIRLSTLRNLEQRFKEAGIKKYHCKVADATVERPSERFDIIICDAPCSGSGTWGRTPEQLYYFDTAAIAEFSERQKKIALNAIQQLQPGGIFFYITCSVFKEENEVVAEAIRNEGYTLLEMQLLEGYTKKADSMFVAVFSK